MYVNYHIPDSVGMDKNQFDYCGLRYNAWSSEEPWFRYDPILLSEGDVNLWTDTRAEDESIIGTYEITVTATL